MRSLTRGLSMLVESAPGHGDRNLRRRRRGRRRRTVIARKIEARHREHPGVGSRLLGLAGCARHPRGCPAPAVHGPVPQGSGGSARRAGHVGDRDRVEPRPDSMRPTGVPRPHLRRPPPRPGHGRRRHLGAREARRLRPATALLQEWLAAFDDDEEMRIYGHQVGRVRAALLVAEDGQRAADRGASPPAIPESRLGACRRRRSRPDLPGSRLGALLAAYCLLDRDAPDPGDTWEVPWQWTQWTHWPRMRAAPDDRKRRWMARRSQRAGAGNGQGAVTAGSG